MLRVLRHALSKDGGLAQEGRTGALLRGPKLQVQALGGKLDLAAWRRPPMQCAVVTCDVHRPLAVRRWRRKRGNKLGAW